MLVAFKLSMPHREILCLPASQARLRDGRSRLVELAHAQLLMRPVRRIHVCSRVHEIEILLSNFSVFLGK